MTAERAHSKFSASGSERWFECPGSVELSEGRPDKSSAAAIEGTRGHAALEYVMKTVGCGSRPPEYSVEMFQHAQKAGTFILDLGRKLKADILVETRVYLDFIHPEMFGTFDGAVIDYWGTLHVFDYKYGSHVVSPKRNKQMLFYGIGLAHKYKWDFKRVRLWIIQPRIHGYDGPTYWELSIEELKSYVQVFRDAVKRVEEKPNEYKTGDWCFFCKAKPVCPLKQQEKIDKARGVFNAVNSTRI